MKKIVRIARLELGVMFYSPIAWLVLVIFMIQCGVGFIDLLQKFEASQQFGNATTSITISLFGGNEGFFSDIQSKLYLYIPLLTMGLLSREIHSGSIKLLLSSPVRNTEIILGKFLAMMIYGLLLMAVIFIIVIASALSIENLDLTYLAGGIFGLYLLVCAFSAVGLFMSSLTSYQVVAAVSTLATLAALKFVGEIGRSIDFIRDITYWISIEGRVSNFLNGLISSKDVIYFLLVIILFLVLAIMKLNSGRVIQNSVVKVIKYGGLIIGVIVIGYISSLPKMTFYYDTTRFKTKTLTIESRDIVAQLKHPITLHSYVNILNIYSHLGSPRFRNFDKRQFEDYVRYLPGLRFDYTPYYDSTLNNVDKSKPLVERAERAATAYGYDIEKVLTDKEIKKIVDPRPENNRFFRLVEYEGKTTPLRMYNDMFAYPHEPEISAALKRLLIGPKIVGIVQGNEERSSAKSGDKAYKNILTEVTSRSALINNGFEVITIRPDSAVLAPDSLSVLIIADPMEKYSDSFQEKVIEYVSRGGNLLLSVEPGKQQSVNKISDYLGISYIPGHLLQESKDYALDLIQALPSPQGKSLLNINKKGIISMPGAAGLTYDTTHGFKVIKLLSTDKHSSWNAGKFRIGENEKDAGFDSGKDIKKELPVMIALTRQVNGKQQKVVVSGDADFMSNSELSRQNLQNLNPYFSLKLFKWFSDNEFPVGAERPEPIDVKILISKSQIGWMKTILQIIIPLLLLLSGAILIINRKRN